MKKNSEKRYRYIGKWVDYCDRIVWEISVRMEIIREQAKKGPVWIEYRDKQGNMQVACVTTVGHEELNTQDFRRKYVEFYDLTKGVIIKIPAYCKPEKLNKARVERLKSKL